MFTLFCPAPGAFSGSAAAAKARGAAPPAAAPPSDHPPFTTILLLLRLTSRRSGVLLLATPQSCRLRGQRRFRPAPPGPAALILGLLWSRCPAVVVRCFSAITGAGARRRKINKSSHDGEGGGHDVTYYNKDQLVGRGGGAKDRAAEEATNSVISQSPSQLMDR